MKNLNLIIAGNNNLVIPSIDAVIDQGHSIKYVISNNLEIIKHSEDLNIKCIPPSEIEIKDSDIVISLDFFFQENNLNLKRNINVFFLNPILSKYSDNSLILLYLIKKIESNIWYRVTSDNYESIIIETEEYTTNTNFIYDVITQLCTQISINELTSKRNDYEEINFNNIKLQGSKKELLSNITACCGCFLYKYFNKSELITFQPHLQPYDVTQIECCYISEVFEKKYDADNFLIKDFFKKTDQNISYIESSDSIIIPILIKDFSSRFPVLESLKILDAYLFLTFENKTFNLKLKYNQKLSQKYILEQFVRSFETMLHSFINQEDIYIKDVQPLDSETRNDILNIYCNNELYNNPKTLNTALDEIVNKFPNKIALINHDNEVSYKDLSEKIRKFTYKINFLANKDIIGVCLDFSIESIIAMLAIMKTGNIYLPLEPKHPKERIKKIISISQCDSIITSSKYCNYFSDLPIKNLIIIDEPKNDDCLNEQSQKRTITHDIAYLIYTSGSTGEPKGVLCTHSGALNMIQNTIHDYPIIESDNVLLLASCAFDIYIWEVFSALLVGGSLVIPKTETYSNPVEIIQYITDYKVTILHMVPSVLKFFLKYLDKSNGQNLKVIVSGGEELPVETAKQALELLPNLKLFHGYGPTETAITALHHLVLKSDINEKQISLGKPLANVNVLVVNKYNQLLSPGIVGELLIGGICLSKGYLNDELRTNKSFIHLKNINKKFYKTGDLVVLRKDGIFKFKGRIDNQIKILGNRIELEEIERNILKLPFIEDVIVLSIKLHEQNQLVACIKKNKNAASNSKEDLIGQLKKHLPKYMIPNKFVFIENIPMLSNGKRDKLTLLEMVKKELYKHVVQTFSNEIEKEIYDYLTNLTGTESFSINDDFYELGFNSLLLSQLSAFIQSTFGFFISVYNITQMSNIVSLAQYIKQEKNSNILKSSAITRVSRNKTIPLSNAQKRLWFVHQVEDQKSIAYNIVNVYKICGKLNIKILENAILSLYNKHEALRTLFKNSFGTPHQVILPYFTNFKLDIQECDEKTVEGEIKKFCTHEFHLDKEVSAKFKVFLVETNFYFVILQHNIVTDGWSTGILIRDLSEIYNALLLDKRPIENDLSFQYADFAAWQNQQLHSVELKRQLQFWKETLNGYNELEFPVSYSRKPRQTYAGKVISFIISKEETNSIINFIKSNKVTLFSYLMACLKLTIFKYTDNNDIVIGSAGANRSNIHFNNIVGFFVNIFPIRTILNNEFNMLDLIKHVHNICSLAISNQDVPFDVLVDHLKVEREPDRSPIFQILFLMQDAANNTVLDFHECDIISQNFYLDIAIFDITFNIYKSTDNIRIDCQYNIDLFSEDFVNNFLEHYKKSIITCFNALNQNILDYSFLSASDIHAISTCNSSEIIKEETYLIDEFINTVSLHPNNIALIDANQKITYVELYNKCIKIANAIHRSCNQEKIYIGICLEKSIDYVSAMLAISMAGYVYIPLETKLPEERFISICEQSKLCGIIGEITDSLKETLKKHDLFFIDIKNTYIQNCIEPPRFNLQNLVYAIFTSGTTGKPKGVRITNSNLMNALKYFKKRLNFTAESRLFSLTTPTFDIFQLECLLPLISGGSCYLYDIRAEQNVDNVVKIINQYEPTHIQATPSLWNFLLANINFLQYKAKAITGGEALEPNVHKLLKDNFQFVLNAYGPTETTIWSCDYDLTYSNSISIGKPIQNTKCYVVDSKHGLCPVGAYGELVITGAGVSPGYFDEKLNKNSFFYKNFFTNHKEYAYKTGDLVRLEFDGNITYLGRMDEQVKVRGYRIELSEVYNTVKQFENVLDATAITIKSDHQSRYDCRIVLFLVVSKDHLSSIDVRDINLFLAKKIPKYMLPSDIIFIDKIPYNDRGKINKYLLKKHYLDIASYSNHIPETKIEQIISALWEELLGTKINNSELAFYYYGGHSLLIPIMLSKIMQMTGKSITIREFISSPTVKGLAACLERIGEKVTV